MDIFLALYFFLQFLGHISGDKTVAFARRVSSIRGKEDETIELEGKYITVIF